MPSRSIDAVDLSHLASKSARIRHLKDMGYRQADIARRLGVSDQHVSNVVRAPRPQREMSLSGSAKAGQAASSDAGARRMASRGIAEVDVADLGGNKSAKMRRYSSLGFSRSAIAEHLGVRYQFVRNVLAAQADSGSHASSHGIAGMAEPAVRYDARVAPLPARLCVEDDGRIVLPSDWDVRPGQVFVARKFGGSIVLMDVADASEAARSGGPLDSAVDDLVAERRLEAMREFDD